MFVTTRLISSTQVNKKNDIPRYSQSQIHMLIHPMRTEIRQYKKRAITQSTKNEEKTKHLTGRRC